jgi:hypothetical protein
MKRLRALALCSVFALWAGSQSTAALLSLNPGENPNLVGNFASVSYDSSSGIFQVNGWTSDYQFGSASLVDVGEYTLTAHITTAGVLTGGSITINGDVGNGPGTLLSGTLLTGAGGTAFGFQDGGGDIFEFRFTLSEPSDPTIQVDFGGIGDINVGIIVNAWFDTPWNGSWETSFQNSLNGDAQTFVHLPEPSSFILVVVGGAFCAAAFRRTSKGSRMPDATTV